MRLCVQTGTTNPAKTDAVRSVFGGFQTEILTALSLPADIRIEYTDENAESGVSPNPRGFQETIRGARNRANSALKKCSAGEHKYIGVGIESGFIEFPSELQGIFNFDVCCIIWGRDEDALTVYGFSQGIEYPRSPVERVLQGKDFNNEMMAHLHPPEPPSPKRGILGVLTDGRYPRQRVSEIAVEHAVLRFIHNGNFYR